MSKSFTVLKTDYVNPKSYETVFTNSLKLNKLYDSFLSFFLDHFQSIRGGSMSEKTARVRSAYQDEKENGDGGDLSQEDRPIDVIHSFLQSFTAITDELTDYQVECIQMMKS